MRWSLKIKEATTITLLILVVVAATLFLHAALRSHSELRNLLEASVGYSPHLLYAFIARSEGRVILHSERAKEGEPAPRQAPLAELLSVNPFRRLDALLS